MDIKTYYEKLLKKVEIKKSLFPKIYFKHRYEDKKGGKKDNYVDLKFIDSKGFKGFTYGWAISTSNSEAYGDNFKGFVVYLYIKGKFFETYFNQLKKHKNNIEKELDIKYGEIIWQEKEDTKSKNVCRIFARYETNIEDESGWDECIDWHIETMIKFLKVLPKYTDKLQKIGENEMYENEFRTYLENFAAKENKDPISEGTKNTVLSNVRGLIPRYLQINSIFEINEVSEANRIYQQIQQSPFDVEQHRNPSNSLKHYKRFLQFKKIKETMRSYDKSPNTFSLNGARMFFKLLDKEYPIKAICRIVFKELELNEKFTTNEAKSKLKQIFRINSIEFIDKEEPVSPPPIPFDNKIKNIILYGVPGVGKTYNIKKLISFLEMKEAEKDIFLQIEENSFNDDEEANKLVENIKERINFITFHQSFGYEDFIEGFRPDEDGDIKLKKGVFRKLCKKAENDRENKYYLVIDEINRGNISKIFGELITLIEEDKRDSLHVTLPYSKKPFSIPSNLYIIGTMNSTDKSIALIDIALRRRFTFIHMTPNPELVTKYEKAKELMIALNDKLSEEKKIGHSYFMKIESEEDLLFTCKYKIKPLLEEYFYGDEQGLIKVLELLYK